MPHLWQKVSVSRTRVIFSLHFLAFISLTGLEILFQINSRYTALDALQLITPYDEYFHCESCNGVLVAESDKLAIQDLGDGDDNARKHRHDKIKDMLSKMEVCPL